MNFISIIPPQPLHIHPELFYQTSFLSASRPFDQETEFFWEDIFDQLVGLMRLPYLLMEAQNVHQSILEGENVITSSEFRNQTLSLVASLAEVFLWAYQHHWIVLTIKGAKNLQKICYLARMVLYEQAVLNEAVAFIHYQTFIRNHPHLKYDQKKEYHLLKLQLVSHSTYLGWVTIELIASFFGANPSRSYLTVLHTASLFLSLIEGAYEKNKSIKRFFVSLLPNYTISET